MLKIQLPEEIEKEYNSISKEFGRIQGDWKRYNDEIIPEDKEFAKQILKFLIDVIDYIMNNYENLEIKKYQQFLAFYDIEFLYGSPCDKRNYLNFDENIDGEPITEFCWKLKDEDFNLSKEELEKIKYKYSQVLSMFD